MSFDTPRADGCNMLVAARWCPLHGDCTCPYAPDFDGDEDGYYAALREAQQTCPLHSPASDHAEHGEREPGLDHFRGILTEALAEHRIARDSSKGSLALQITHELRVARSACARLKWMEDNDDRMPGRIVVATSRTDPNTGEHYETEIWTIPGIPDLEAFPQVYGETLDDVIDKAIAQGQRPLPDFGELAGFDT